VKAKAPDKSELDPIETASRDELEALQLERLRQTLNIAYAKVDTYRRKFDEAGFHPDDLTGLGDLPKIPFTMKEDLRQAYPFGMFAVPREELVRIHASSGTTGKPTVVGYTKRDIDTWALLIRRALLNAGARPGDILHNAYGYGLFTGGLGIHNGGELLGCAVVPVSGGMTERQVQLIDDFKPRVIAVTPSYMLAIADEFDRQGIDSRQTSLEVGVFGAEPWTESIRHEIEDRFDLKACNHFGLSEIMGPGVGSECVETQDGITIYEDHFIVEIIDPATGENVKDGEVGELVLSTLTKEGMPMVRFRTRDLTKLMPPTVRSFKRIDRLVGRSDDMLIIRGVNLFPSHVEELILKQNALSPHYFIEVRREGPLDEITVVVEARPTLSQSGEKKMNEQAGALKHAIKTSIGVTADVKVLAEGAVERSMGKAQRIIDLRPKT
jgi:phenylacetate-CoA ligase